MSTEQLPLTVDEAVELYPNEWMLMRVTECDEHDSPARGIIVAHRRTRKGIQKAALKAFVAAKETGDRHYLFFGFRRYRTLADWEAAVGSEAESAPRRWMLGE